MARTTLVPAILACGLVVLTSFASTPPNLERTLTAQQELVSQSPYDSQAHNDLGNLLILAGRDAEAEEAYRRAIELDPLSTGVRFNLALLQHQNGRFEEARESFEELLAIDSRHAWAHYQLGVLHDGRGDRSKALEHYARAFAYDPTLSFASNNPHVIDNKLSTEALLMSDRYRTSPATRAPRHYNDPQRIADLLLESEESEDQESEVEDAADAEEAEDAEDAEPKPAAGRRGKRPVAGDSAGDSEDEGPAGARQDRVRLEQGAAEGAEERPRGTVGSQAAAGQQVGGPAGGPANRRPPAVRQPGAPAGPPASTSERQEAMDERFKALRERMRDRQGAPGDSATDVDSATGDDRDAATQTRVAPRRQRYRPGSASTGRLELKLLPEPSERLADLGDAPPA